jgi:hypothetical protein
MMMPSKNSIRASPPQSNKLPGVAILSRPRFSPFYSWPRRLVGDSRFRPAPRRISSLRLGLDIEPTVVFSSFFRNWYNLIHHYFLHCLRLNFMTSLTSRAKVESRSNQVIFILKDKWVQSEHFCTEPPSQLNELFVQPYLCRRLWALGCGESGWEWAVVHTSMYFFSFSF